MTYKRIIDFVIYKEGLERILVFSESRKSELCECRYIIWTLAKSFTDLQLAKIGRPFHRSHSDVITGINRFNNIRFTEKIKEDKYQKYLEYFREQIKIESDPHIFRSYKPGRFFWMRKRPRPLHIS